MPDETKESLIGVSLDDLGKPTVRTVHRDGTEETAPFPDTGPVTDGPQSWRQPRTGPLTERRRGGLTRAEHIIRSLQVEAALVEIFGGNDTIDRSRLKDQAWPALRRLLRAVDYDVDSDQVGPR